jgi:6-phosphogluconolactonase
MNMARRFLAMKNFISLLRVILLVVLCCGCGSAEASPGQYLVYVGTYTDHGSKGIYAYRFDAAQGLLTPLGLAAESDSPSFLTADRTHKFLYAVNEVDQHAGQPGGTVSAFAINQANGKLSFLNQVSAHDPGPAYISMDRTGKFALIANYPLGSVAAYPIRPDGKLGEASSFVRHKGSSIDKNRQTGPHGHAIELSPDNRFAIAADLGLDELIVYPFDGANGRLGEPHVTRIQPGSGPRHIAFRPDGKFLYLINEMGGTITALSYGAGQGRLTEVQTVSTLPKSFKGENSTAEIAVQPSGKFLYGSNRGDESIVEFAIDQATGKLAFVERVLTGGKTPRNFALDPTGRWLLAENQDSNNIVTFRVDQKTGKLTEAGRAIEVDEPVCLVFVPTH